MNAVIRLGATAALAMLAMPSSAWAFAFWTPSSGSTSLFSYSDGHNNDVNLFGNPTVVGNTFVFAPSNFAAVSVSGSATASDTVQVVITVQPGQTVTGVRIREVGTRTSTSFTTLQGTLRVKDLTVGGLEEITTPVVVTNGSTQPPNITNWTGDAFIGGLSFGGGVSFQLTLTNSLTALFGSEIRKNGVEIEIVPTPGAMALVGLGAVALRRRRRA
jgi:uncharacterized protein (TIGR03382 family)